MLPVILVAVGAYLIGDSVLEDKKYAKGGMMAQGGMVDYSKDGYVKAIRGLDGKLVKEVVIEDVEYRYNPIYKTYNSIKGNELLHKSKYAHGGKTQGYDDKEDERLAMEHGKMAKKDLDSTHARRDDARFEERGKMAKGGKIRSQKEFNELVAEKEKIVKNLSSKEVSDMWNKNSNSPSKMTEEEAKMSISKMYLRDLLVEKELTKAEYNKYFEKGGKLVGKQKNLDVNKNGKLDAEDFKMLRGKKMAKGGEIGKKIKLLNGNYLIVLKKENNWGISEYNPKTKKEVRWFVFQDEETANYWINKVSEKENSLKGGYMAKGGEVDDKISKVVKAIRKTRIDPDDVSPNFVNKIANEIGVSLSSKEVVYISDNYDEL